MLCVEDVKPILNKGSLVNEKTNLLTRKRKHSEAEKDYDASNDMDEEYFLHSSFVKKEEAEIMEEVITPVTVLKEEFESIKEELDTDDISISFSETVGTEFVDVDKTPFAKKEMNSKDKNEKQ